MSLSLFILSDSSGSRRGLSRAEVYLQACRRIGAVPVSAFVRAVSDTTVNLNRYGVGPRGARALAVALKVTVVTKLELEDNRLKAEGTRYLMKMLQSNTTIESLNISHNQLGLEGASVVSKIGYFQRRSPSLSLSLLCPQVNSTLKQLLLSHSSLGGTEAKCLSQALTENRTLELLDLSANTMDDEAAGLLSLGLTSNPTLRVLKVRQSQPLPEQTLCFVSLPLMLVWLGSARLQPHDQHRSSESPQSCSQQQVCAGEPGHFCEFY
uniref:Leucine rich repeat containing 74A n=1 Tax=Salarias fasciatus TaxID=181472 RepID=A0A672GKG5_SALFA